MTTTKVRCTACGKHAFPHATWKGQPYHFGCVPEQATRRGLQSPERAEYGHSDPWNGDDLEHLDGMLEDRAREQ